MIIVDAIYPSGREIENVHELSVFPYEWVTLKFRENCTVEADEGIAIVRLKKHELKFRAERVGHYGITFKHEHHHKHIYVSCGVRKITRLNFSAAVAVDK